MCMYVCIIYMHHVYAAAHRGQRVLDPLGGVRRGCEMPDVGARYGTWVWNLGLEPGYGTWPSVRAVVGIND